METPITHPLEVYFAYILITAALTFYFSRARGKVDGINPGSVFTIMIPVKILAALFFFGIPGVFIYALPEAAHPRAATAMTLVVCLFCTFACFALTSTKLIITEDGLIITCLRWKQQYRFDEFKGVTVFRSNIVLERKIRRGMNPAFPAMFSNIAGLYTYLRGKIESPQDAPGAASLAVDRWKKKGPADEPRSVVI